MLDNPFTLLKHTINVLVVDDMPEFWSRVKGLLDIFGIYSVHVAESTKAALEIINNGNKRIHACALDRGMNDVERNEFYLLEKFSKTIPFIIMTARDYSEKTFECGKKGAMAYLRKNLPAFNFDLVSGLNKCALLKIICPKYNDGEQSLLCRSVDSMIKNNPQHVNEWARGIDILESKLWKEWKKQLGVNPKYALCIFHIYFELFNHINEACMNNDTFARFDLQKCGESLLNSTAYKRCLEYYLFNRLEINNYISMKIPSSLTC